MAPNHSQDDQPCFQGLWDLAWARLAHPIPLVPCAPTALLCPLIPAVPDLLPLSSLSLYMLPSLLQRPLLSLLT